MGWSKNGRVGENSRGGNEQTLDAAEPRPEKPRGKRGRRGWKIKKKKSVKKEKLNCFEGTKGRLLFERLTKAKAPKGYPWRKGLVNHQSSQLVA